MLIQNLYATINLGSTSTSLSTGAQKGFAPVLIVLIIAVLAIGGGFLVWSNYSNNRTKTPLGSVQPQTRSTLVPKKTEEATNSAGIANWKTYTNSALGLSFKYPELWELTENSGDYSIMRVQNGNTSLTLYPTTNPDAGKISVP